MDRAEAATTKETNQKEGQEEKRRGSGNLQIDASDILTLLKAVVVMFLKATLMLLQAFVALLGFLLRLLRSYNLPPRQHQRNLERERSRSRPDLLDDWPELREDIYELPKIDLGFGSGKVHPFVEDFKLPKVDFGFGKGKLHPFVKDFVDPPRKSSRSRSRRRRKDLPMWLR